MTIDTNTVTQFGIFGTALCSMVAGIFSWLSHAQAKENQLAIKRVEEIVDGPLTVALFEKAIALRRIAAMTEPGEARVQAEAEATAAEAIIASRRKAQAEAARLMLISDSAARKLNRPIS